MNKKLLPFLIIPFVGIIGSASAYFLEHKTDVIKNSPLASLAGTKDTPVVTNTDTNTGSEEQTSEETKDVISDNSKFILVSGFPVSEQNKNMLIALYNTQEKTINFFPYNYYTGVDKKEILSFMSIEEIYSFLKDKGLDVSENTIYLDQEDVFSVYADNFDQDSYMTLIENGKETEKKIWMKEDLYRMIKDYSNEVELQEQILNTLLVKYLIPQNNNLESLTDIKENLYGNKDLLAISEKPFIKTTKVKGDGKGVTVYEDKNFTYLQDIASGKTPTKLVKPTKPKTSLLDQLKKKEPTKPLSIKDRLKQR